MNESILIEALERIGKYPSSPADEKDHRACRQIASKALIDYALQAAPKAICDDVITDETIITLAKNAGFYIRGKQQGLRHREIAMPILQNKSTHEMLIEFAYSLTRLQQKIDAIGINKESP